MSHLKVLLAAITAVYLDIILFILSVFLFSICLLPTPFKPFCIIWHKGEPDFCQPEGFKIPS